MTWQEWWRVLAGPPRNTSQEPIIQMKLDTTLWRFNVYIDGVRVGFVRVEQITDVLDKVGA